MIKPDADPMLVDCISSHDACTWTKRAYAKPWPEAVTKMRELEARGLLRFVSLHREQGTGAMIRRSTITERGLAEIGASRVLGLAPSV